MSRVAFIGTGLLGSGMVDGMLRRGETVVVWNRTASKAQALEALGATVAADRRRPRLLDADRVHIALVGRCRRRWRARRHRTAADAPGCFVIDHTTTAPAVTGAA